MLNVRRSLALALTSLSLVGGAGAFASCQATSTPATYTPVTGVALHLSDLLGKLQCGTAANEVYKYTVVVWYAGNDGGPLGQPVFSDVWDCFADGVLENLPAAADGGSVAFYLKVYGYTLAGTEAAQSQGEAIFVPYVPPNGDDAANAAGPSDAATDGGYFRYVSIPDLWCPGGLGANGLACPLQDASVAESFSNFASWSTSCVATETEGAPVTAICGPLLATETPEASDGSTGDAGPADAAAESGNEAQTDAAADAEDAAMDASIGAADAAADSSVDASSDAIGDALSDGPTDAAGEASD